MTDTTAGTDAPVTPPTPPAPDPNDQAGSSGVQLDRTTAGRVGARAIGVEYGNPYDPDTPPYSVYNDPQREAIEAREAEEAAEAEIRSKARGTAYVFQGHESPYEWTEVLKTRNGSARIGETVVLSKDDYSALVAAGFVLEKTKDK